uniref:HNH endonuclease n=1 Tax=viral metagenome TaxID=1070528 RepID=A0A6M3IXV7_9ZZZZ
MSRNRRYPRPGKWEKTSRQERPGIKACTGCARPFGKKEVFRLRETQVNWFRGDDEVEALCPACYVKEKTRDI